MIDQFQYRVWVYSLASGLSWGNIWIYLYCLSWLNSEMICPLEAFFVEDKAPLHSRIVSEDFDNLATQVGYSISRCFTTGNVFILGNVIDWHKPVTHAQNASMFWCLKSVRWATCNITWLIFDELANHVHVETVNRYVLTCSEMHKIQEYAEAHFRFSRCL